MRTALIATLGLFVAVSLAACGDSSSSTTCSPNSTRICTCANSAGGSQACNAIGTAYLPCVCGNDDAGVLDGPAADGPAADGPAADGPRADVPVVDGPLADAPRVDAPRADAPRADGPRADGPRADGPRVDGPRADGPRADGPRADGPLVDGPSTDGSGGPVALHGVCGSAALQCASALLCVSYDQAQSPVCYQNCSASAAVCTSNTDGRTTCLPLSSTVSTCVEQIARGGQCDLSKSKVCAAADVCQNGTCVARPVATRFAPCAGGTSAVCGTGQTCVDTGTGLTHGFCLDNCNPATPTCTTAGSPGRCVALSTAGSGACLPNGTGAADIVCGQDEGQAYSAAKQCGANLVCLTFTQGAAKGMCLPTVSSCTGTPCASGRVCLTLTGGTGACAQDCSSAATICTNNNLNCSPVGTNQTVCTPAGSVAYAGVCSGTTLCAPGLTCLRSSTTSTDGYCTQACTSTPNNCPAAPSGTAPAQCFQLAPSNNLCVFNCASAQTCPTGLTCQTVPSTGTFCLAP